MIDSVQIQIIVSELHRIAKSPHGVSQDKIEPLLKKHREVIDQLSERLAIVNGWLDKGLITEAIHLECRYPPLLETLKEAGLGDSRPTLVKVADQLGIDRPALPSKKMIERLRGSKDQYAIFESALQEYRHCCLIGKSIKRRLEILANLKLRDPSNFIWIEEMKKLEPIRIAEINRQAKEFYQEQNVKSLQILLDELKNFDWQGSSNKKLIQEIDRRHESILTTQTKKNITRIFEKIKNQFVLKDKNKVAYWFGQIEKECESTNLISELHVFREENKEVFDWIDSVVKEDIIHNKSKSLFDRLEYFLDKKSSMVEIEKVVWEIEDIGVPIPLGLLSRLKSARSRDRDDRKQFLIFRVGGIFLLAFALIFISYMFVESSRDQKNKFNLSVALETFERNYLTDGIDSRIEKINELIVKSDSYLNDVKIQQLVLGVKQIKKERERELSIFKRDIRKILESQSCDQVIGLLPKVSGLVRGNVGLEDDLRSADVHVSNLCATEKFKKLSNFEKELKKIRLSFNLIEKKFKDRLIEHQQNVLKQEQDALENILKSAERLRLEFKSVDDSGSASLLINKIEKLIDSVAEKNRKNIEYKYIYEKLSSATGELNRIDLLNDLKMHDPSNQNLIRAANASSEIKSHIDWRGVSPGKNILKALQNFEELDYWKECCEKYLNANYGVGTNKRGAIKKLLELITSTAFKSKVEIVNSFPERIKWYFDERLSILPTEYGATCYHVNEYSSSEDLEDRRRFTFNRIKNTEDLGQVIKVLDRYAEFSSEPVPPWDLLKNYYVKANIGIIRESYMPNPFGSWKLNSSYSFLDSLLSIINLAIEGHNGKLDPMPALFFVRKSLENIPLNSWCKDWIARTESLASETLDTDWADPGNDIALNTRSKSRKELRVILNLINENKKTFEADFNETILGAEKFYYCGYFNIDLETGFLDFFITKEFEKANAYVYVFLYNLDTGSVEVVKAGYLNEGKMVIDSDVESSLVHGAPFYIRKNFVKGIENGPSSSNKKK